MPTAEIIAIGNELLIGRTQDTNTYWLAQQLNTIGLRLAHTQIIADEPEALVQALNLALSRAEVVICTGGLGPTKDDLTKKILADYFGSPLALHQPTLQHIEAMYTSRGRQPNAYTPIQATLPTLADILFNAVGTAPGMRFTARDGREVYALPGVPHEMKHLFEKHIRAHIAAKYVQEHIRQHTLRTAGLPESDIAGMIEDLENALPPEIFLAYNPGLHAVDLRLNLRCAQPEVAKFDAEFDRLVPIFRERLGQNLYGEQDVTLSQAVGQLLVSQNATVGLAESCTGGALCHALVEVGGASAYVRGGLIPYSNDLKISQLGVSAEAIATHGAVSEAVVMQLAEGARRVLGCTWGVGITGIAGPDGGSEEKPVGTVWIAVAGPDGTRAKLFRFEKDRARNIQRTVVTALDMLRRQLLRSNT